MTEKQMALAIAIAMEVLTKGPEVIVSIADLFREGQPDPTPEEIRAQKITKPPEEYFEEGV